MYPNSSNVLSVKISKITGLAPPVMSVIPMAIAWKNVPLECSNQTTGMFLNSSLVNAETLKIVGDVTIATSTILNSKVANAETLKIIGVVKIVILILPNSKDVNVEISKTTGIAIIVI